jgi:hypothetical protein
VTSTPSPKGKKSSDIHTFSQGEQSSDSKAVTSTPSPKENVHKIALYLQHKRVKSSDIHTFSQEEAQSSDIHTFSHLKPGRKPIK